MKKTIKTTLLSILIPALLMGLIGEVILEKDDYIVIDTGLSYTVAEDYSLSLISEGDKLVGNLNSYGFNDVYNCSTDNEINLYIEDYWLDRDDAIELLYELAD